MSKNKTDYNSIVKKASVEGSKSEGKPRTFWIKDKDYEEFRQHCKRMGSTMGAQVVKLIKAFNRSKRPVEG